MPDDEFFDIFGGNPPTEGMSATSDVSPETLDRPAQAVEPSVGPFGPAEPCEREVIDMALALTPRRTEKLSIKTLEDGTIVPVNKANILPADQLMADLTRSIAATYEGKQQKHQGKTKLVAALDALSDRAADGDKEAIGMIMDRIAGKPAQLTKSVQVNVNMAEFLDQLR